MNDFEFVFNEFLLSQQKSRSQDEGHRGGQGDSAQDPHREDPGHQEALLLQVSRLDISLDGFCIAIFVLQLLAMILISIG